MPDSWLVVCQADVAFVTIPIVLVSTTPGCPPPYRPTANPPQPLTTRQDLLGYGLAPALSLTTGTCLYTVVVEVYGVGAGHTGQHACAY